MNQRVLPPELVDQELEIRRTGRPKARGSLGRDDRRQHFNALAFRGARLASYPPGLRRARSIRELTR
jgi:hypothetical protein